MVKQPLSISETNPVSITDPTIWPRERNTSRPQLLQLIDGVAPRLSFFSSFATIRVNIGNEHYDDDDDDDDYDDACDITGMNDDLGAVHGHGHDHDHDDGGIRLIRPIWKSINARPSAN